MGSLTSSQRKLLILFAVASAILFAIALSGKLA